MARRKKAEEVVEEVKVEESVAEEPVTEEVPVADSLDIADPVEDTGVDKSIAVDGIEGYDIPNFDEPNGNVETPIVTDVTEDIVEGTSVVEEKPKKKSTKKISVKKEDREDKKESQKKEDKKSESESRIFVGKKVYRSKSTISVMFNNFTGVVKVVGEDDEWTTIEVFNRAVGGVVLGYIKK